MTVGLVDVRCVKRIDTEQEKYVLFGTYMPSLQRVILSFRNSRIPCLLTLILTYTVAAVCGGREWNLMGDG